MHLARSAAVPAALYLVTSVLPLAAQDRVRITYTLDPITWHWEDSSADQSAVVGRGKTVTVDLPWIANTGAFTVALEIPDTITCEGPYLADPNNGKCDPYSTRITLSQARYPAAVPQSIIYGRNSRDDLRISDPLPAGPYSLWRRDEFTYTTDYLSQIHSTASHKFSDGATARDREYNAIGGGSTNLPNSNDFRVDLYNGVVDLPGRYHRLRPKISYTKTVGPPPAQTPVLAVDRIEVVQVVQTIAGDVPLVARKSTVVRVFPKAVGRFVEGITGTLRGFSIRNRVETEFQSYSPVRPFNAPMTAFTDPKRENEYASLDFLLPPGWTAEGEVKLVAELTGPGGMKGQAQTTVTFQTNRKWPNPLAIGVVRICVQGPGDLYPKCPSETVRFRTEYLNKLYPVPDDGIWYYPLPIPAWTWTKTPVDMNEVKTALKRFYQTIQAPPGAPFPDQLVGWLPRLEGASTLGTSDPKWLFGQGRVAVIQDTQAAAGGTDVVDFLDASHSVAHELAHNFGLQHPLRTGTDGVPQAVPGSCSAIGGVADWPYPDATINEVGYDPEKKRLVPAGKSDLMTYCSPPGDNIWISPFQYRRLFSLDWVQHIGLRDAVGPALNISGEIYANGASATLKPSFQSGSAAYSVSDPDGEFCVQLHDSTGVVRTSCFSLAFKDGDGNSLTKEGFSVMIPAAPGIQRIVVVRRKEGAVLAALRAGLTSPEIRILEPADNVSVRAGSLTLSWTGSDRDGEPVWYAVQVSPDGDTFYTIATDLTTTQYTVDTSPMAGGRRAHFRVVASDGIHNASATVGPVTFTDSTALTVAPARLDFGDVVLGQTRQLAVTLTNPGTGAVELASAASDSGLFTAALSGGASQIPGGGTAQVTVTFRPDATGSQSATLTIATKDRSAAAITVALAGRGVDTAAPLLAVSPARLAFGTVALGKTPELSLSLLNNGAGKLTGKSIASSNPQFSVTSPTGSFAINAHSALQITVRFSPSGTGAAAGNLTIESNDPVNPSLSVPMTGNTPAGAPAITVAPSRLEFGTVTVGQSKSLSVTIGNNGSAGLSVTSIGGGGSEITFAPLPPYTLPPRASQTVTVTWRPAAAGAISPTLSIASNDPASPNVAVAVSGTGAAAAASGSYLLHRIEVTRGYSSPFEGAVFPGKQVLGAGERRMTLGWDFLWPESGQNRNRSMATLDWSAVPASVTAGAQATFGAAVSGEWIQSGYGVARDHTVRLEGDAGTGQFSVTSDPSGAYQGQFTASRTAPVPAPDGSGQIAFTARATIRFGDDHQGSLELRFVYLKSDESYCAFTLGSNSATAAAAAGSGSVSLTASSPGCAWTAASDASWLSVSPVRGTGSSTLAYSLGANTGSAVRTGVLTIGGLTFHVLQPPLSTAAASYSLDRIEVTRTGNVGQETWLKPAKETTAAGQRTFLVGWDFKWGDGNANLNRTVGTVSLTAVPSSLTPGAQATAAAQMAGEWNQTGYGVNRDHTIRLTGAAGIQEYSTGGSANGTYRGQIETSSTAAAPAANSSGEIPLALTALIRFGDDHWQSMEVKLVYKAGAAAGCSFALSPAAAQTSAAGGPGSVAVSASASSCPWTAARNVSWINLTSGSSGTGNGTVVYTVEPNTAATSRAGTLTIAGLTFTVTQAGASGAGGSVTETVLQVDGGSFASAVGYSAGASRVWFVNRLTPPSYPATLKAVQIYFGDRKDGLRAGAAINVVTASGNVPDDARYTILPGIILATGTFNYYAVAPITITSGDFIVGFQTDNPRDLYIADLDTAPPTRERSYASSDGSRFWPIGSSGLNGNLGIRAAVTVGR
jgi:hypothetical protein